MPNNTENTIKHFQSLASQRMYYESRWVETAKYIAPNKKDVQYDSVPGAKKTDELFDGLSIQAKNMLVATLTGSITSASKKWLSLRFKNPELNNNFNALEWLDTVKEITYHNYNRSNLYRELNLLYDELVTFGTDPLFIDSLPPDHNGAFTGLTFKAMPLKECYIEEGVGDLADILYRKFRITAYKAVQLWGIDSLPDRIKQVYKDRPFEYFTVLHGVYRRDTPGTGRDILLNTEKEYASVYISLDDKKVLSESGYDFFPFAVPRWAKYSGEVYGRGPADEALPDIRTLNKIEELSLKWDALRYQPPLLRQKGSIIGQVVLEPRAIMDVQAGIPSGDALRPLELGGDTGRERIKTEDKRIQIRKAFFADQIEAFIAIEAPRRTATEVQLRYDLMQQMLGPILTNIEQELLNPLVNKTLEILFRNNAFPVAPQEVLEDAGDVETLSDWLKTKLVIEYESPLSKRQRIEDVMALQGMYEYMAMVAPYAPDIGDGIDHDEGLRHVGKIRGVPIAVFRKEEDFKAIRQGRVEEAEQEQQAQEALALTQGLKNVAPMVKALPQGAPSDI